MYHLATIIALADTTFSAVRFCSYTVLWSSYN